MATRSDLLRAMQSELHKLDLSSRDELRPLVNLFADYTESQMAEMKRLENQITRQETTIARLTSELEEAKMPVADTAPAQDEPDPGPRRKRSGSSAFRIRWNRAWRTGFIHV